MGCLNNEPARVFNTRTLCCTRGGLKLDCLTNEPHFQKILNVQHSTFCLIKVTSESSLSTSKSYTSRLAFALQACFDTDPPASGAKKS